MCLRNMQIAVTNLRRATECYGGVFAFKALLAQTEIRQCHVTLQWTSYQRVFHDANLYQPLIKYVFI